MENGIEIWKDLNGYEGIYQVSNFGNVKSLSRITKNNGGFYLSKEKYMEGVTIFTDIPNGNFFVQLDPLVETQSLDYAHTYAIQYFDNLGYHCTFL